MITVTLLAAEKAKELMAKDNKKFLRIAVSGGGCSGLKNDLLLEDEKSDTDIEFELNGVKVIIDPVSIQYLKEAVIDFIDTLTGGGFTVTNPNWKGTCGCGSSFDP